MLIPAEIVLLHIGTNDIAGQSAAGVAAEIGQILDNIDTYSPDVWVILARIINRETYHSETTDLNEAIQILADARIGDGQDHRGRHGKCVGLSG